MKAVIIGGGVSGLAAGIYAQMCGIESEIHEKHFILGGQCTGWKRKGYTLDNCVHWLTGTNPDTEVYKVWEDVGVLGDGVKIIQPESFMQVELDGQSINLWQDTDRLKKDMLAISPEDAEAIEEFIGTVCIFKEFAMPGLKPFEMMTIIDKLKFLMKMKNAGKPYGKYSKMSIEDYASKFRHPLLRKLITTYLPYTYNAASMFYTFGTFCSGNGALPEGGSLGMVARMEQKYRNLGGKVFTSHEAVGIDKEDDRISAVRFKDGSTATGDYIILACDTNETFRHLIGEEMMDGYFRKRYKNEAEKYRIYCSINCYLSLDGKAGDTLPGAIVVDAQTPFLAKHFDYEPSFAPDGKSVIQTISLQYEDDYDRWKVLYDSDREAYRQRKAEFGEMAKKALEQRFPEFEGKLEVLDVATPVTHERYCNAYKGAYMSFILTPFIKKESHAGRLPGLKNLILAGQWLQSPGGLPNAVVTGRFAIQRLCKTAGLKFCK